MGEIDGWALLRALLLLVILYFPVAIVARALREGRIPPRTLQGVSREVTRRGEPLAYWAMVALLTVMGMLIAVMMLRVAGAIKLGEL